MKKIKVVQLYGVHYIAGCQTCDFNSAISYPAFTAQDVRNKVRAHVLKTGHTCWIERGDHTEYSLVDDSGRTQDALDTPSAVSNVVAESNGVPPPAQAQVT
jgi:hypothetical protein